MKKIKCMLNKNNVYVFLSEIVQKKSANLGASTTSVPSK